MHFGTGNSRTHHSRHNTSRRACRVVTQQVEFGFNSITSGNIKFRELVHWKLHYNTRNLLSFPKVCSTYNKNYFITNNKSVSKTISQLHYQQNNYTVRHYHKYQQKNQSLASICLRRNLVFLPLQWRIQKFWKGGNNLSAPSSFIANAHNDLYRPFARKRLFGKKLKPIGGGGRPPPPPSL